MSSLSTVNVPSTTPQIRTREPSEFAEQAPRLRRLAALPPQHPDRAALREDVIRALLPLSDRIAARYCRHRWAILEDLRQVASVGLINAVDRWDPGRAEGDVLGYLVPCVRGEILRYFRDRTWAMHVPRRLKELAASVRSITPVLTQELGRAPRPSELARRLDADVKEVIEALQAEESHDSAPLDAPWSDDDESTLADRIPEIDTRLELVDDLVAVRPLLERLPDRERRILELRFFGDCSQSQIAEEVGISQMHVSRLLSRTLAGLRHELAGD